MAMKAGFQTAGWVVAGVLGGYVLFDSLHQPDRGTATSTPTPTPAVTLESVPSTPIPYQPPSTLDEAMARAFPASEAPVTPPLEALAEPQSTGPQIPVLPAPTLPTPDPRAELERQYRMQISRAKGTADSLETAAKQECPDLKPGDLRLPEAINQCVRLRAESAQAAAAYENIKKEALLAGLWIQ